MTFTGTDAMLIACYMRYLSPNSPQPITINIHLYTHTDHIHNIAGYTLTSWLVLHVCVGQLPRIYSFLMSASVFRFWFFFSSFIQTSYLKNK